MDTIHGILKGKIYSKGRKRHTIIICLRECTNFLESNLAIHIKSIKKVHTLFNPVTVLSGMYPNGILDLRTDVHLSIVYTCDKLLTTSVAINGGFFKYAMADSYNGILVYH